MSETFFTARLSPVSVFLGLTLLACAAIAGVSLWLGGLAGYPLFFLSLLAAASAGAAWYFFRRDLRKLHAARPDEFLNRLSHDLRTPIGSILGLADILISNGTASPAQKELLEVVVEAGENAMKILGDLVEAAKKDGPD